MALNQIDVEGFEELNFIRVDSDNKYVRSRVIRIQVLKNLLKVVCLLTNQWISCLGLFPVGDNHNIK